MTKIKRITINQFFSKAEEFNKEITSVKGLKQAINYYILIQRLNKQQHNQLSPEQILKLPVLESHIVAKINKFNVTSIRNLPDLIQLLEVLIYINKIEIPKNDNAFILLTQKKIADILDVVKNLKLTKKSNNLNVFFHQILNLHKESEQNYADMQISEIKSDIDELLQIQHYFLNLVKLLAKMEKTNKHEVDSIMEKIIVILNTVGEERTNKINELKNFINQNIEDKDLDKKSFNSSFLWFESINLINTITFFVVLSIITIAACLTASSSLGIGLIPGLIIAGTMLLSFIPATFSGVSLFREILVNTQDTKVKKFDPECLTPLFNNSFRLFSAKSIPIEIKQESPTPLVESLNQLSVKTLINTFN